jgi:hypothetical protein
MMTAGLVIAVLGVGLSLIGLATTHVDYDYVVGRTVETPGAPSAAAIVMIIGGLVLAGIGFARRLLAAVERR